jgi:hypothetical protein
MAKKITELNALTAPDKDDVGVVVNDPTGSPETQKITLEHIFRTINDLTNLAILTDFSSELAIIDDPGGSNNVRKVKASVFFQEQGLRITRSTTQSIATATWDAVEFNAENFDFGAQHSTVSNTDRINGNNRDGVYIIGANVGFAANATGTRRIRIQLNGSTTIAQMNYNNLGGSVSTTMLAMTSYILTTSDYITCEVYQDSGGNLNVNAGAQFWAHWVDRDQS